MEIRVPDKAVTRLAAMGKTVPFFADWTVGHPTNKNGELLQHCGPWPLSLVKKGKKAVFGGPFNQGTYLWIEVENCTKLEDKLVQGSYVHHCVGIHSDVVPPIYEACKYIPGLTTDLYDDNEEEVKAWIRGE